MGSFVSLPRSRVVETVPVNPGLTGCGASAFDARTARLNSSCKRSSSSLNFYSRVLRSKQSSFVVTVRHESALRFSLVMRAFIWRISWRTFLTRTSTLSRRNLSLSSFSWPWITCLMDCLFGSGPASAYSSLALTRSSERLRANRVLLSSFIQTL